MEPITEEKSTLEIIEEFLEKEEYPILKNLLVDLHPADIAEVMTRMGREEQVKIMNLLQKEQAGEVLVELDSPVRTSLFDTLGENWLVPLISELDSDDAADIINELDKEDARRVMAAMPWEDFRDLETLLRHEEDTAGGIMALEIVAVEQSKTAQQALDTLRKQSQEVDDVYNIYVVDKQNVLVGVLTLKELVLAHPNSKLKDIMETEPIVVEERMDQEEVANLFSKYSLVAAPVVNLHGRLVGRITVDDVLHVVEEETSEDFNKMAGIQDEEIHERSAFKKMGVRLPWLMIAFVGEMISAFVLKNFEMTAQKISMAVFFIPLVMAMGGNMGVQSAIILLRGLATGDIRLLDSGQRILREAAVGFLNGLVISILLGTIIFVGWHDLKYAITIGIALLVVLVNATLFGTMIPLFLKKVGIDPAIATGPFITTLNDVFGLLVYFAIITLSL